MPPENAIQISRGPACRKLGDSELDREDIFELFD
jgi:hypothetical protein